MRRLEELGAEVVEIDTVFEADPVPRVAGIGGVLQPAHIGGIRGTDAWAQVDPSLAAQVDWAAEHVTPIHLVRAFDACHHLNTSLVRLCRDVRLLVTPTCAAPPPPRSLGGQGLINGSPDANWVRFTYPFNMTRSPAATVCAGLTADGLPVGVQLVDPSTPISW